MIDSRNDLTFSTFYITEFFNQALKKASQTVSQPHFGKLEEVCKYLLQE